MRNVSPTSDSKGCNLAASETILASLSFTVILLALLSEGGGCSIPVTQIESRSLVTRLPVACVIDSFVKLFGLWE